MLAAKGFAIFSLSFDETRLALVAARLGHPDFIAGLSVERAVDGTDMDRPNGLRALLHSSFSSQFMASAIVNPATARDQ